MRTVITAAVAALSLTTAAPALAQSSPHVGQWSCQFSYTELNPDGSRQSGFVRQFQIALYPNGTYQAQGTMSGAAGHSQFRSQGQWRAQGQAVMAQGQEESTASMGIPSIFGFTAILNPGGGMSASYEQPDPSRRYVMNRSITQCQRG
jgi:hypothetical protein